MTFSLALPKSLDSLLPVAAFEGENGRKSATSQGGDGFAELLNQLASVIPPARGEGAAGDKAAIDRQAGDLPTGNSLPVADPGLPLMLPEMPDSDEADEASPVSGIVPFMASPIAAPVLALKAPAGGVSASRTSVDPMPATDLPKIAMPAALAPGKAAELPIGAQAASEPKSKRLEVRIAAAGDPSTPKAPAMTAEAVGGKARMELPVSDTPAAAAGKSQDPSAIGEALARPDGARPIRTVGELRKDLSGDRTTAASAKPLAEGEAVIAAKLATGEADAAPKAERVPTARAATTSMEDNSRPATHGARVERAGELAAASDREGKLKPAGSETAESVSRMASPLDGAKSPIHAAGRIDDGTTVAGAVPTTARPVVNDQFAQVERIVDQIMAARHVDFAKAATIAVAHKDFGDLTVTFDSSNDGMNVRIAAEDSESHRALAAAMAQDRGPVRQQETVSQAHPASTQTAQAGAERGANSGQTGTGFGQGGATGEQRQQQGEQRGRASAQSNTAPQHGKPSSSDDALYA
ncbi:hypothetical protein [Qipengyuania sp.]|uniref:hypothetical protein n=1 Tax=Qipengyuania sp. TaxID=2004515 RepID=UPI003AF45D3C